MGATSTDPTGENPLMNVDDSNAPQHQPMEEDDNDEQQQQQQLNGEEEEDVVDETPAFVSADDAVEVQVDDDQAMMDEDDDDDAAANQQEEMMNDADDTAAPAVPDLSHVQLTSHTGPVYAVRAYLRDDNHNSLAIVTGGGDDKAFVHRVSTDSSTTTTSVATLPLSHPHTDSVSAVAWNVHYVTTPTSNNNNNNPRLCAVGGYDGAIALYDANDETAGTTSCVRVLEGPTDVECLAWHPKGGTVLLAGSAADGTLWMYHTGLQGKVLQVFVGHEAGVSACDFTADGKHAVSASSDGTLRIWAPRTGQCKHVFRFPQPHEQLPAAGLTCLAVGGGADRQLLLVGAEDGHAHVCHGATQKVVAQLTHADATAASNNAPGENDNDDDEAEGAALSVEAVGFSPSHPQWCATAGVDGVLKIWDLSSSSTPHCRQVCRLEGVGGGMTRLVWHPTLPLVFTASTAGTVDLWDARDGTRLHTLTGHAPNAPLNDMDVHIRPDNGHAVVVSGSDDHTVRVFDVNVPALWNRQPPTESQA